MSQVTRKIDSEHSVCVTPKEVEHYKLNFIEDNKKFTVINYNKFENKSEVVQGRYSRKVS